MTVTAFLAGCTRPQGLTQVQAE